MGGTMAPHPHRHGVVRVAILGGVLGLALCSSLCHAAPAAADPAELLRQATALEHGEGVERDTAKAADLYCEAARLGQVEAQFSLGWMYANGRGVARDDGLAALFFGLAARQGHVQAKNMLRFVGDATPSLPECMKEPDHFDDIVVPADATPQQQKLIHLVQQLAPEYSIHPRLALAVLKIESNFQTDARSPKNAQGLMQLIPGTAERFNVKNVLDPVQNLRGGLAYLRWLLAYFQGNVALATAGYNAGEKAVDRFLGVPPFEETRAYVKRIRELFPREEHPFDASVVDASPALPRIRQKLTN